MARTGRPRNPPGTPCPQGHVGPRTAGRRCAECRRIRAAAWRAANADKVRARRLRWEAKNVDKRAAQERLRSVDRWATEPGKGHGRTRAEIAERLARQGGACACCGKPDLSGQDRHGDHDHATGAFRGVLCRRCNTGIGMLGDTLDGLRAAICYLERHEQLQELL